MAVFPIPKGFQRMGSFPIDDSSIFGSLFLFIQYVEDNPCAFVGQLCSVLEDDGKYYIYVIQPGNTYLKIGAGGAPLEPLTQEFIPAEGQTEFTVTDFIVTNYRAEANDQWQTSNTKAEGQVITYYGAEAGVKLTIWNLG